MTEVAEAESGSPASRRFLLMATIAFGSIAVAGAVAGAVWGATGFDCHLGLPSTVGPCPLSETPGIPERLAYSFTGALRLGIGALAVAVPFSLAFGGIVVAIESLIKGIGHQRPTSIVPWLVLTLTSVVLAISLWVGGQADLVGWVALIALVATASIAIARTSPR